MLRECSPPVGNPVHCEVDPLSKESLSKSPRTPYRQLVDSDTDPLSRGGYALGERPKHVQNMHQMCARYATLKLGLDQEPISHHPCIFVTKCDDFFYQKEVLIVFFLPGLGTTKIK